MRPAGNSSFKTIASTGDSEIATSAPASSGEVVETVGPVVTSEANSTSRLDQVAIAAAATAAVDADAFSAFAVEDAYLNLHGDPTTAGELALGPAASTATQYQTQSYAAAAEAPPPPPVPLVLAGPREGEGSSNDKRKASPSEIVVPEEYLEKAKRRRLDLAPLPEESRSGPEAASGTSNSDDEGADEDRIVFADTGSPLPQVIEPIEMIGSAASSHGPAASISAASATAAPAPPSAPEASTSASVSATAVSTVEGTLPQAGMQEPVGGVKREETGITLEVKKEILNGDNAIGDLVEVQEARRELQAAIERLDRALSGGTRNAQVKDEVEDIKPNLALGGNSTADPIEID
ncbi:hypothetical protein CF335_g7327 [Tilletia laevis]|nr:hypothetical protein CF335_g7327 [Tilletia laevis]